MTIQPVRFAGAPTPLQRTDRLAEAIGLRPGQLFIKRDDLTSMGGGGNKARKLEYLCAHAKRQGATALVTGGAAQSNHVRMTAVAAAMTGFDCIAVLGGKEPDNPEGNLVLDQIAGARLVFTGDGYSDDLEAAIAEVCAQAPDRYLIPLGGSSPVGCLGYVEAADEIEADAPSDALVFHADGSGGTHAGLVAGFGNHDRVMAVDVGAVVGLASKVERLAAETALLAGRAEPTGLPRVVEGFVGRAYGARTDLTRDAIKTALRHAGVILDPVYSGKAFGALMSMAASGSFADRAVVFVATGGAPALFTDKYRSWVGD